MTGSMAAFKGEGCGWGQFHPSCGSHIAVLRTLLFSKGRLSGPGLHAVTDRHGCCQSETQAEIHKLEGIFLVTDEGCSHQSWDSRFTVQKPQLNVAG